MAGKTRDCPQLQGLMLPQPAVLGARGSCIQWGHSDTTAQETKVKPTKQWTRQGEAQPGKVVNNAQKVTVPGYG